MKEKIENLLKAAIKRKDSIGRNVYRSILTDFAAEEHSKNAKNIDYTSILVKAYNKRIDAKEQYIKGDRADLADFEHEESLYIDELLPKLPTKEELINSITKNIKTHGINMGKIIKSVKEEYPRADGKNLSILVKDYLFNTIQE